MVAGACRLRRSVLLASFVVAAMAVSACADGDAGSSEGSTSPTTSTDPGDASAGTGGSSAGGGWRVEIEAVGCEQFASNTGIDPAKAARFIPAGQELYLDVDGLARVSLVTKSCDDFVVNGDPVGPGHMDTLWIRVPGPSEGLSLPGDPELEGPTPDAFVPQFIQTDNAAYRDAVSAYGVPLLLADEMSADPPGTDTRAGTGTNSVLSPPLAYRWMITAGGSGGRSGSVTHLLRGTDVQDVPIRYAIECSYEGARAGAGSVRFEPDGPFEALLGTGWDDAALDMRIDCRIAIEPSG